MTKEFKLNIGAYLEAIEMPETFRKRVLTIYEFYLEICPEKITSVFVTDYLNKDGARQYENLWFFSETYLMEAKQFITKDDFDIHPRKDRICYLRIQKQDYDFKKATEKSKINLFLGLEPEVTGDFKASKENCDYLKEIIIKHIIPNLMK